MPKRGPSAYSATAIVVRMDQQGDALVVMLGTGAVLRSSDGVAWSVVVRSHPDVTSASSVNSLVAVRNTLLATVQGQGAYRFEAP